VRLQDAVVLALGSFTLGLSVGAERWATAAAIGLLVAVQLVVHVRRGVRW